MANIVLGKLYGSQGKFEKAIMHLKKAVELDPKNLEANYYLGVVYLDAGDLSNGIVMLDKVYEIDNTHLKAMYFLALACRQKGLNQKAAMLFDRLQIKDASEARRDKIMQRIFEKEVAVNVHFIPLPMMTYYKSLGNSIDDFPVSYQNYSQVISLPVYYDLTNDQTKLVKKLDDFLNTDEFNCFLLKGYAGTGKTFITKGLTEYLTEKRRNSHRENKIFCE